MFKTDFDNCVSPPESITCEVDGFHCVATAHYDADTKPDSESMPLAAFSAWANDEWFYVGVAVTVSRCDVQLTGDYDHALWGIDCNFPNGRDDVNWYMRAVANDLLADAIDAAKRKIGELCT